jgi:hypothetical protein
MPVTTFDMGTTTNGGAYINDGMVIKGTMTAAYSSAIRASVTSNFGNKRGGWLIFSGITIAQNSVINSVDLKLYTARNGTPKIQFFLDNRSAPTKPHANPGAPTQVLSTTNVLPTNTTASPTATVGSIVTPGQFALETLNGTNLKDMIQAMVNSFDYSNGYMLFYARDNSVATATGFIYNRDWGAAQQAELVIDYSESSARGPDKTTYRYG